MATRSALHLVPRPVAARRDVVGGRDCDSRPNMPDDSSLVEMGAARHRSESVSSNAHVILGGRTHPLIGHESESQ